MMKVNLIRPLYSKIESYEIGKSKRYLALGFVALFLEKDYKRGFQHFIFTVVTLGYYWFYFYKNGNNNKIFKLLRHGYKPASKEDEQILLENRIKIDDFDSGYVGFSRTGSVDHKITGGSADHLRSKNSNS